MRQLSISANIMVKDAEKTIQRCIESLLDFVDEIVIVDTGSVDKTVNIIAELIEKYAEYDIKLMFCEWNDDFAEIRNFMKKCSSSDIILEIDADEFLKEGQDLKKIKEKCIGFYENYKNIVLLPVILEINGTVHNSIPRIYRNDVCIFFVGNVHEELRHIKQVQLKSQQINLIICHEGYTVEQMVQKSKLKRNIFLLKKIIEKEPQNVRWKYFLIREMYYAGADKVRIIDEAERLLSNYKETKELKLIYMILGACYSEVGNYDKLQEMIWYLEGNNAEIDALFLELLKIKGELRKQSLELDRVVKRLCEVKIIDSQINSNADHLKVQLFELLFTFARYDEAFCIAEEVNCYTRRALIIPRLEYI